MKKTEYRKITAASAAFFIASILCIMLMILTVLPMENAFGAQAEPERDITRMHPSGVKAASYNYSKIRISWDLAEGADGYAVYRSSAKNGTYKRCYTAESPEKNWYINTNRKAGTVWWYKVRAYQLADGKKVFSKYSVPVSAYARPGKVKVTGMESTGFIYRYLNLSWKPVRGADGYQVYMKERDAEKFTFMGNFEELEASVEIPDTTKEYDLKVRAYCLSGGKKVYGRFSEVASYGFDWTEGDLREAGEAYIRGQWPEASLDGTMSNGQPKTPYNGTSWLAVWPKRFCRYEPWEEVKAELTQAIEADVRIQGSPPQEVWFYVAPGSDINWVEVYLLK